jgi:hypothetical protein
MEHLAVLLLNVSTVQIDFFKFYVQYHVLTVFQFLKLLRYNRI